MGFTLSFHEERITGWRSQGLVHHTLQFSIFQSCIFATDAIWTSLPAGCRILLAMAVARN
jgi:hypothetical protein